jgi:hypothetical protein
MMTSLLRSEQNAFRHHTGDKAMWAAKEKLSAKAMAKLDLATTIAALSLVAATFIVADLVPVQSTSSTSSPASSTPAVQVQILRECDEGVSTVAWRAGCRTLRVSLGPRRKALDLN